MKKALLVGASLLPFSAHAFDLYGEWSGSVNPSHGWSYGYRDSLAGDFHLFDQTANENHFHFWRSSTQNFGPAIGRNEDDEQQLFVPASYIGLLPRQGKWVSVSKYQAVGPLDHMFLWNIQSMGNSRTDVVIRRNGQIIFEAYDSYAVATGRFWFANISATYELLIGPGTDGWEGDARYLRGHDFRIASPEPSGIVTAAIGGLALVFGARRRKQKG